MIQAQHSCTPARRPTPSAPAAGIKTLPYFLANSTINLIDVGLQPLVFLSVYYSLTLPAISFAQLYLVGVLVVWYCSSMGCLVSILISPANSLVTAVAIVMVTGGFVNGVTPAYRTLSTVMKGITGISYNRWAVEAVAIMDFEGAEPYLWPITRAVMLAAGHCGLDSVADPGAASAAAGAGASGQPVELDIRRYCANYSMHALVIMFCEGLILRLTAYLALQYCSHGLRLEPLVLAVTGGAARAWKAVRPRRRAAAVHPSPASGGLV